MEWPSRRSPRPGRRRLFVAAALCALAGSARAAEGDDAPMLGEAVVRGDRPRRIVREDPTGAATVVSADAFLGEAKGVAELASTAPGVAVNGYGGLGQFTTASIRGSAANGVLVLVDGLPLDSGFGGGVDLASIPRSWIDRVEIVRGPEGAYFGQGSLGGVVNVITRRPRAGAWSAEAAAGSFDSFSAAADATVPAAGGALLLSAAGDRTGGAFPYEFQPTPSAPEPTVEAVRRNDGAWRAGAMAKLGAPLGGAQVDAVAQLSAGRRELPGWPYALTPDDWQSDGRVLLAARVAGIGPGGLALSGRGSARVEWLDDRAGNGVASQGMRAIGAAGDARWSHGPGELRLALDVRGEEARIDGPGGARGRLDLAASLGEDVVAGDRLRIAPALRVEKDGPFEGWSGKLGGSLRIAGPFSLRASAGRTFRAPTEAELYLRQGLVEPNPALRPEVGVGGDGALVVDAGPVFASVGGHATLYRDLIYFKQVTFDALRLFNAEKALVEGLEVEVATVPARALAGLALQGSWTLLDTEILRGVPGVLGKELPHRARHRLYARLSVSPGPAALHAEAHWVGAQWADDRNLQPIPAALTWNAGGSVRFRQRPELRVALEVRNLLDDRSLQDGFGNPLPGRSVLLTLSAASDTTKGTP
jgi:vitamin B12 transporter